MADNITSQPEAAKAKQSSLARWLKRKTPEPVAEAAAATAGGSAPEAAVVPEKDNSQAPPDSQPPAAEGQEEEDFVDLTGLDENARKKKKAAATATAQSEYKETYNWFQETSKNSHGDAIGGCTLCQQHNPNGRAKAFIAMNATICSSGDLKAHEDTPCHQKAIKNARAKAGEGDMDHALKRSAAAAAQGVASALQLLCLVVLFIIKEHMPMLKLPALFGLLMVAGVNAAEQRKYTHYRWFIMAMRALSEIVFAAQVMALQASPFYSILADSSTDVSGDDHLLLYARYIRKELDPSGAYVSWQVVTEYLCTVKCIDKTASGIVAIVDAVLAALELDPAKMVGFGSDGASVFTGKDTGVGVTLRARLCYLLLVHCVAHRTALVMGDAARENKELAKIDRLLRSVHGLFSRSSKWQGKWERFAKAHGCTKMKFPAFNTTRWFSRMVCVVTLVMNAHVLLRFLALHQERWPKGRAVYKKLRQYRTLSLLFVLRDMLGPCEKLSKACQADSLLVHEIGGEVEEAKAEIRDRGANYASGKVYGQFRAAVNSKGCWVVNNKGVRLTGDATSNEHLKEFASVFAAAIIEHLDERFADVKLLSCFRIFHPATYDGMDDKRRAEFGLSELLQLLGFYCSPKNKNRLFTYQKHELSELKEEFSRYKKKLSYYASLGQLNMSRACLSMVAHVHLFPRIWLLVCIACVLPAQTACVERGFSRHRIIKNRLTNRLQVLSVDSLLRVGMLAPDVGEDAGMSLIREAAALCTRKGYKGKVHALFEKVNDVNSAAFGEEEAEWEDEQECEMAYPASGDEADSEAGSEAEDDAGSEGVAESDGDGAADEEMGSEEVGAEVDGDDDLTLAEAVELRALGWD